jgi:hypothetical protein
VVNADGAMRHAVRAAQAHADAAGEIVRFLQGLDDPADPAVVAEYANLLAYEQTTREARTEALRAAGLTVPSLDGP